MSDLAVLGLALGAVTVVVTLCATLRPGAAAAIATALHALAAVFAAAWPWKRQPWWSWRAASVREPDSDG